MLTERVACNHELYTTNSYLYLKMLLIITTPIVTDICNCNNDLKLSQLVITITLIMVRASTMRAMTVKT